MDENNSLTETDGLNEFESMQAATASVDVIAERKAPVVSPTHKAVKKKSTITKLVLFGVVMLVGMIFAFVPMSFGLYNYYPFLSKEAISLGLDLQGGVYAVYQASNTDTTDLDIKMDGTRSALESLLASKGYTEATVVREGTDRIRVEVPDVDDPGGLLKVIGEPTTVKFVLERTNETIITGDNVINAAAGYDNKNGYVVSLEFDSIGRKKFAEITADSNNKGQYISIFLGDSDQPVQRATINDTIPDGRAIISGGFTQETATELAGQIMSGTFDVALKLKESHTISPTLGENAMNYGLIAGVVGFVLVVAFLCVIYRMLGLAASLALVMYVIIYLFFLAVLPWVQLTLPGIAGILLSIGMAVDANVIIFERIKDEYAGGKSIMAAYHAGFKKALFAILDSNVTTVIACILLMLLGTGSISGFALTLLVGVLISLFSALILSRMLIKYFINLNSYNEKLYNLKRGKMFEHLDASSTDANIMAEMKREQQAKEEKQQEKQRNRSTRRSQSNAGSEVL